MTNTGKEVRRRVQQTLSRSRVATPEGSQRRPRKISEQVAVEVDPKDKEMLGKATRAGF